MNMDYLDEATVAINQSEPDNRSAEVAGHDIPLSGSAVLKHELLNQSFLQGFGHHDNNLINASAELLGLCASIHNMSEPDDLYRFRQGVIRKITDLKQRIGRYDYPPSVADKTCFLFSIVLDELILHSDWAENSGWENQTFVSELFGVRNGGEQFYWLAEKALSQPKLLLDLVELIYIFIRLGFRGQYRQSGRKDLEQLTHQLERVIFQARPAVGIQCQTQVKQPGKKHLPARPAHFLRQLLLFLVAIALAWGATRYWYQATLEQRARDFIGLSEFSQSYLSQDDDRVVTYTSTDEEMSLAVQTYGRLPAANSQKTRSESGAEQAQTEASSASSGQREWTVQLATVNNLSQGEQFIQDNQLDSLGAEVRAWKNRYRVIIVADSRQHGNTLVTQARSLGVSDAFLFLN